MWYRKKWQETKRDLLLDVIGAVVIVATGGGVDS